ncbi:RUN and SH3 domain-containing protein 1 isoform X1 [Mauremys mutica]|uniref:RUN and SH3 domain-containing protein 1 n=1 Tax=Mauremys mutica TaxID=74926 RepID=A0A9D4AX42_9SAUR|nr:RUN and SH3 domain-containing protein 1 isoform X1 [Mauremys mutica]KAH1179682.1 hypothetical protein KIL84_005732 [Mauremys mutica]
MLSPKKGLLCNLNHIHLQHISLGLHLSRRPELQEGPVTMAPGDQTGCNDCQENCGALEQVDANSNNTSMQCRCCKSHPQQTPTLDLRNQPLLEDFPSLPIEEEVASPSHPASSSVSSCSDFSLDDTPVSVYCKAFPGEEALSPDNQPNIVPLEDAHDAPSLTDKGEPSDGRDANLNLQVQERPDPGARETPDSLCSSSLLDSASDDADSPSGDGQETMAELLPTSVCAELDSNCNALPALRIQPSGLSALAPGKRVPSLNSSVRAPPPVPPRAKRGLQVLNRSGVERPAPTEVPPGDQCRDATRKNVTSFHELAQKRKRNPAGPPTPQARKDRSDWLIVFSPDKELPPPNELTCCSTLCPEPPGHQLQPDEQAKPPSCSQREVTTFKELRYRNAINKQKGQLAWEPGDRAAYQEQPEPQQAAMGRDVSSGSSRLQGPDGVLAPQLDGHLLALTESHQMRRQSRPGLQPITEGLPGDAEEGGRPLEGYILRRKMPGSGCDKEALGWRLGGPEGDLWVSGKAQRGHRACKEVGSPLSRCPRPQMLPFQPLLFHFSADGKPLYCSADPVAPPLPLIPSLNSSLESIELKSPALFTPSFRPTLKTLSCDEVCLLASNKRRVLGTLSPEELLPIRLSPIGAYSPPHRGVLPFLDSPDLSVLFSPLFPRSRTFPTMAFPSHQVPELPLGVEVSRARCPRGEACAHSQAGARSGAVSPERKQSRGAKNPRPPKQLRHSQSFAGVPGAGQHWMANADRAYDHLREQKKALLVGISASVEKLIAHFSTARSLVQKTQLGDSWLNPDVSYLLLNTLCPALYALVVDGLKPFQKDIITGQRRSSPWSVVEASVKLGPGTRPLHSLYWQVSQLAPLRSSRQRFHAFILGLLNIKQLELWLSHLQKSSDVISVLYLPTAFFSLSHGPCPHLARELLLLVQPLSVLTFHLDLLFEHHHLPVDVRPVPRRPDSPHSHPLGPALVAAPAQGRDPSDQAEGAEGGASPEHQLPTDGSRRAALVGSEESARSQYSAAATKSPPSLPAGIALKQTFQQVLQWGEQITQTLLGPECPAEPEKHQQPVPPDTGERRGSWWEQLSQASEVYTTATKERFPFARWTKLQVAAGDTSSSLAAPPHGSSQASTNEFGAQGGEGASGTDLQLLKPRAGEGGPEAPGPTPSSEAGSLEAPHAEELPPQAGTKGCAGPRETEPLEPSASKPCLPPSKELAPDGSQAATPNLNMGGSPIRPTWLGRLFGATCLPARGFPADSDTSAAKSRRPSSWLPRSVNVLALVLKGGPSEKAWPQEQQEKKASDSAQLHRAVRALCDHTGAGDDHLSFRRGDILQLLATVDEDWIRCCHGNNTGLVPVGYTSLIL